jgi:hypothetical protein
VEEATATAVMTTKPLETESLANLRPVKVSVWFHADNQKFDATLWITNDGTAPALGSFEITFGYSYYDHSQDPPLMVYHERKMQTPGTTDVQPGGTNPFEFPDIAYIRDPGSTRAPYTFYASVDDLGQIAESDDADNDLTVNLWLRPPLVPRPKVGPAHM